MASFDSPPGWLKFKTPLDRGALRLSYVFVSGIAALSVQWGESWANFKDRLALWP